MGLMPSGAEGRVRPMTTNAISVESLVKRIGTSTALDGVNLEVGQGQRAALLGPNGAGKTTLVSILCGLLRPDGGRAVVAGHDVTRQPAATRAQVGVVFQDTSLDTRLSVAENLEFHGLVYGMPRRARATRAEEMLHLVELSDWREAAVRTLSGGMKRRLEIARALMHAPRILFLDEPTTGLDAQTRERIWSYLDRLRRETGLTLLVTTHYTEEVDDFDRIHVIDHGRTIADGTPHDLKTRHGRSELSVRPRDDTAREAIISAWPDARTEGGHLVLPVSGEAAVDAFLAEFGSHVSGFDIEAPTLSGVFLSLTGRDLRDRLGQGTGRLHY